MVRNGTDSLACKCDGNHPICVNCNTAEMRCSYLSRDVPQIVPVYSPTHSGSPAQIPTVPPPPGSTNTNTGAAVHPFMVNMTHIELFNNLQSKDFLALEVSRQPDIVPSSIYIRYSLTTPYLMHQVLATSAFHLSTRNTELRDFYREYSTGLQNCALSLFQKSNPTMEVTPENFVQMFLFSSLVGVHLLCDTLHYARKSLDEFIDSFTNTLSVYRGVIAIIEECRELLRETELEPGLKTSQILMESMSEEVGCECDSLRNLFGTADLPPSKMAIYQESTFYLQQLFDAHRHVPANQIRVSLVIVWPILVSPDYVELLQQREPIALIILAHYAVLLHRGKDLWLMGDGGRFLLEAICGRLGPDWKDLLKYPSEAVDGQCAS